MGKKSLHCATSDKTARAISLCLWYLQNFSDDVVESDVCDDFLTSHGGKLNSTVASTKRVWVELWDSSKQNRQSCFEHGASYKGTLLVQAIAMHACLPPFLPCSQHKINKHNYQPIRSCQGILVWNYYWNATRRFLWRSTIVCQRIKVSQYKKTHENFTQVLN